MKKPIKVGVIGLGRIGKLRCDLVKRHPQFKLTGVCDVNSSVFATALHCRAFTDYRQLLTSGINAVFVCTPNLYTPSIVTQALDQGLHVFAEKPPGRDLGDMQHIIQAEKRNPGFKLKFGFNHRYHDGILDAKAMIDAGQFGRILWMRGVYGKSGGTGFEKGWRSDKRIAGGGILLDQGIHMLDLFGLFCGEFTEIRSFVSNSYWNLEVEDNAFAILRNNDNQVAMIHSSSTHWKHTFLLEIFLTQGYVAVKGILSNSRTYGRETLVSARRNFEAEDTMTGNPREETITYDEDVSWKREVDEFAKCILLDQPVRVGTSADAWKAMELVYRIYEGDPTWGSSRSASPPPPLTIETETARIKR